MGVAYVVLVDGERLERHAAEHAEVFAALRPALSLCPDEMSWCRLVHLTNSKGLLFYVTNLPGVLPFRLVLLIQPLTCV